MSKATAKTAADLMSREVVTLGERDSLQEAMKIMTEQHVSGVPVTDPAGHCLGVISTSDIVAFIEADQEELEGTSPPAGAWFNPETQKWEESMFSPDLLGEYDAVPVTDAMTSDPLTVAPSTPVGEVARLMVDSEVHRVFVVDEQQRLEGVISAFDFVELVAGA